MDADSLFTSPLPVFASGFALRAADTAWLVGAGASAESGVPTASQLVDLLLIELYCRDHGVRNDHLLTNDRWRDLVYPLYSGQGGLPAIDEDAFYSAIFERVYPDPDARARFVMERLGGMRPNYGQHLLAAMIAQRQCALVVTTNFDTLVEDAVREMLTQANSNDRLTVLEPQNSGRANFAHASNQHPLLVKIHGDYGSVTLSNTESELSHHDPELRDLVTAQLSRFGLVVAGYSGRDPAVMKMLTDVLGHPKPYPAGLTWVRRPENPLSPQARRLLQQARDAGVSPIHEVVAGGFGELMSELARPLTFGPPIQRRLDQLMPPPVRAPAKRPDGATQRYPQLRFGAVELTGLPTQARALSDGAGRAGLSQIRKYLRDSRVRATVGVVAGRLAAFGPDTPISTALNPLGIGTSLDVVPIVPLRNGRPSSGEVGMLTEALAQGLGRTPGLTAVLRAGHRPMIRVRHPTGAGERLTPGIEALRVAVQGSVTGVLKGSDGAVLPWAEAVTISIEYVDGSWLVLFAPDLWVRPTFVDAQGRSTGTKHAAERAGGDFARDRLAPRYNRQAGAIFGAWLNLLTGGGPRTIDAFGVGPADGIDATFTVAAKPVVSYQLAGDVIPVNRAGFGK